MQMLNSRLDWRFGDMKAFEGVSGEMLVPNLDCIRAIQRANGVF